MFVLLKKDISYIVISDIHFGHPVNRSDTIASHLYNFLEVNNALIQTVDIIFLAGDIFDTALNSSSMDYHIATSWLSFLAQKCMVYNIKLRVLEGTPSHDAKQCKSISNIIENLNIKLDYKYIDTLLIETMNDSGLTILYVPDEVNADASVTLEQVKTLIEDNHLIKVDIAMVHGSFSYRYRGLNLPSTHDELEYLKLVDRFISVGHEHVRSVYGRIIGHGSFDRLQHGEEDNKGGVYIKLCRDNKDKDEYIFMINEEATIFKSIVITTEDVKELSGILDGVLKSLPIGSNILLKLNKSNPINKTIKEITKKYNGYRFKVDFKDKKNKHNDESVLDMVGGKEVLRIGSDNISKLVIDALSNEQLDKRIEKMAIKEFGLILDAL